MSLESKKNKIKQDGIELLAKSQGFANSSMTTVWHQSLSFKFIIFIACLLSVLMSVLAYSRYNQEIQELDAELIAKGESLAQLTSFAVVESVLAFDTKGLEKPVEYLNKESDITYAVIYSAKKENLTNYIDTTNPIINSAIATVGSDDINRVVDFLSKENNIEQIRYPITYSEFNLGHVLIGMSRDHVIEKSSELLYQNLIEGLALILILGIAIYSVFKVSTIEPLQRLIKGLSLVSKGELDYRVNISNKNELGILARTFNQMVDELLQARAEKESALIQLEDLNNDLALDVEARSDALTKMNEELDFVTIHDSLTQLPNRDGFFIQVSSAIEQAKRKNTMVGLVMLNLDRFKEINESKGHTVGDGILVSVANRLSEAIRGNDCVGRFGGDEFVILIDNVSPEHLILVTEKLVKHIEPEIIIEENKYFVTASLGLAIYPADASTPNDLIRSADIAMHESKETKVKYTVYHSKLESSKIRHMDLSTGLRTAIEEQQLFLEYQPKIDINNSAISGAEALVRWLHPTQGIIPPNEFIGVAENTGLIKPLTAWVLKSAIAQNGEWYRDGLDLNVSINLSMLNLEDESLAKYIESLLNEYELPAHRLTLEVTETMIMGNKSRAMTTLTTLHDLGIHISIDDFGTGFSSLAYLHKLPVDEVKIDRSFVLLLNKENMERSIVHSIIELGHNLSLSVVAEGVEDADTVLLLSKLHCDIIQGYYFSKPLSVSDLGDFCKSTMSTESLKNISQLH